MPLFVIAGPTGSGKTQVLSLLQQQGQQVISLEALAGQQGSVFSQLHSRRPLTAYQFHKRLASLWKRMDLSRPVYCECKSPTLGTVAIPHWFFQQMRTAPALWMAVDKSVRLQRIVQEYGHTDALAFHEALGRLSDRLSYPQVEEIADCYQQGKPLEAFHILIDYYDQGKYYQAEQYNLIAVIHIQEWSGEMIAYQIVSLAESYLQRRQRL